MAGPAKSRTSGKARLPRPVIQSRPRIPAAGPGPSAADLQQRLGNRGAMQFASAAVGESSMRDETALAPVDAYRNVAEAGSDAGAVQDMAMPAAQDTGVAPEPTETAAPGTEAAQEAAAAAGDVPAEPVATAPADVETERVEVEPETPATDGAAAASAEEAPATEPSADESAAPVPEREAVSIQADSPGGVLNQLVTAPPTQSMQAYRQAGAASAEVLGKQADEAQTELPEMPAPTGLTPTTLGDVVKGEISKIERAPQELEGEQTGRDTPLYPTAVDPGPPARPPAPTVLSGREESDTEGRDRELAMSAQNALNNVRLFTGEIPESAGSRPGVDLTGDADPTQMEGYVSSSGEKVRGAANTAMQDTTQDFGEHEIFPPETDEILRSERQLGRRTVSGENIDDLSLPADVASALDESTGPIYRDKAGPHYDEYLAGEDDYRRDSAAAHTKADQDIGDLEASACKEQLGEREKARLLVGGYREEWQEKIAEIDETYKAKADKAKSTQRDKIDKQRRDAEQEAEGHLAEAERKAAQKKREADAEVAREKEKKRKKSGGFWGWAKRAASALVDALKKAVNFIYDNLRKAVKGLFELAKKLALAAIELARKAIVGLIKAFGEVLKGLVTIALVAFPETAEKMRAKIDGAVNVAVDAVNAAADALKKGVAAIIDFLASTIDSLLGLIQSIYNGIFTVIGMIIRGEFKELLQRLGNLVDAARMAPSRFETAAYEELLGGNLDEPLSPMELAQVGKTPKVEGAEDAKPGAMPTKPWTPQNVGVDAVDGNMQLSPELTAQLLTRAGNGGALEFGESDDAQRSMEAVLGEVHGNAPETESAKYPPDGLTPRERAEIKWTIMKEGLSRWWQENKPIIIAGAVAAIVGGIAALILSGGAILGAIPPIMAVLGPIFIGVTIAMIATRVRDYVSQSWEGNIMEGSKSLAKALAAGAIELISLITFKAGGALLKGGKAAASAGIRVLKGTTKAVTRAVATGTKYVISKGKVLFRGVANSGIGKRVKSLREMGERLLARTRFRKFRFSIKGRRFRLEGYINPWILLSTGEIKSVPQEELLNMSKRGKTARVGHKVQVDGVDGIVVGSREAKGFKSAFVQKLEGLTDDVARQVEFDELSEAALKARERMIKGSQAFDFAAAKKQFGAKVAKVLQNRGDLRKALKMGSSADEAHHVLPIEALQRSPTLQKAVKAGFKFNGKVNGRPVSRFSSKTPATSSGRHASHPNYTKKVLDRLEDFDARAAAGKLSNSDAKEVAESLAKEIGDLIDKTKGKIDDLAF